MMALVKRDFMNTQHSSVGSYGSVGRRPSAGEEGNGYTTTHNQREDIACPMISKKTDICNFWSAACINRQLQDDGGCRNLQCDTGEKVLAAHSMRNTKPKTKKVARLHNVNSGNTRTPEKHATILRQQALVEEARTFMPITQVAKIVGIGHHALFAVKRAEQSISADKEAKLLETVNEWKREK